VFLHVDLIYTDVEIFFESLKISIGLTKQQSLYQYHWVNIDRPQRITVKSPSSGPSEAPSASTSNSPSASPSGLPSMGPTALPSKSSSSDP
jgi:hypothetical protein